MSRVSAFTQEDLLKIEKRVLAQEQKYQKKKLVNTICVPFGNLLCCFCFLITTFGLILSLSDEGDRVILQEFTFLMDSWNKFVALLPADLPSYASVLAACVATIVVSIVVSLILSWILMLIPGKTAEAMSGSDSTKVELLLKRYDTSWFLYEPKFTAKILSSVLYAVALCAVLVMYLSKLGPLEETVTVAAIVTIAFMEAIGLAVFAILRLPVNAVCNMFRKFKKDASAESTLKDYKKYCKYKDKEEQERLKKKHEEEEKLRKYQAKLEREAKEREAKEKRLAEALVLYNEAMQSDPPDEEKMKQAAEKGNPDACLRFGKDIVEEWSSGMYTEKEKERMLKEAVKYLENATEYPEGEFLWLVSRISYESNDAKGWKEILDQLRALKKSGKLPEQYAETCDDSIRLVVGAADSAEKKEEEARQQARERERQRQAEANRQPVLRRKYCKFANGAICTYYSTSSSLAKCNYMQDPGKCSACLLEHGLCFEYE